MAGAALGTPPACFAWQAQHLEQRFRQWIDRFQQLGGSYHPASLKDLTALPFRARECKELTLLLVRDCQDGAVASLGCKDFTVENDGSSQVKRQLKHRVCGKRWTASFSFLVFDGLLVPWIDPKSCETSKLLVLLRILVASYIKSHRNTESWFGTFKTTK